MFSKTSLVPALALVGAMAAAAPAFAGPAGTGLGLTEEVARRAAQQRTVVVAASGEACAATARDALKAHPAVARVAHGADHVRVTFRSAAAAGEHRSAVEGVVQRACG